MKGVQLKSTALEPVSCRRASAWHAGGQEFESPWLHLNLSHRLTTVSLISKSDFCVESDWLMQTSFTICGGRG